MPSRLLVSLCLLAASCATSRGPLAKPSPDAQPGPVDPGPVDPGPVDPGPVDPGPGEPSPIPEPPPGPGWPDDPGLGDAVSPNQAKLALRGPTEVSIREGGATFQIVNVDTKDWVFDQPEASNGCGGFRWTLELVGPAGTLYDVSTFGVHLCAQVILPAHRVVLRPGESVDVTLDTSGRFTTEPAFGPDAVPKGKPLAPGRYTLFAHPAGASLALTLTR